MRKMIALVLGIISLAGAAAAEDVRPLTPETAVRVESMASIPVLDNGRLKPLDSYARGVLLQFSGKDTYMRKPALVWLAALLFAPESTQDDKVFLINNPDIPVALGIEPVHTRRYSFKQIRDNYTKFLELAEAAAKIKEKDRSLVEAEVIRVFDNGGFTVPKNYVGTAKFVVVWTATLTSGDVVWDIDYRAVTGDNSESLDQAGNQEALTVTDTAPGAANRRLETSMTATAGNFAADDTVTFELFRDGTDAADTMAGSAMLFDLIFEYADA